ncbi:MAG: hypothetical protein RL211_864 [Pseudomonadota bacterium]
MRKADWKSALIWICALILTLLVMGWLTRQESDRQLKQDIRQSAMRWSQLFSEIVPDPGAVFPTGQLMPSTRERLQRLSKSTDVFAFRLYDPGGRLLLASEDLDKSEIVPYDNLTQGLGHKTGILQQVLGGNPSIALRRAAWPGGSAVHGEAHVPLLVDRKIVGIIEVHIDQSHRAANATQALLRIAAGVTILLVLIGSVATYQYVLRLKKQRKAEDKVHYLAHHDVLSGAMNRASFNNALGMAARSKSAGGPGFSLLRIDLDRFKEVNDSLGHALGDEALRLTTQRLKACLRESDKVARLGGDEFAVLLMGEAVQSTVTPFAKRIRDTLAEPIELSGHEVLCGASIGIVMNGSDGSEPDDLMTKADQALFRAKKLCRGSYAYYDDALDRQMQAKRELTRDLRQAISTGQLLVYYQPQYGNDGDLLIGYEALVRWKHPKLGMVTPGEFIPLAETSGLIDEIGLWVLQQACKDAQTWPSTLTVAVNLSANQFAGGKLVKQVARALQDSGLAPERLGLEITESLLMTSSDRIMETLRQLAALGVSIAMDDFGTGYSSLAYLWRFPFDKVKIDQVFTRNLTDDPKVAVIVHSIIMLAHSLGMTVNAEGVETRAQISVLRELGCDELQGFFLGRPTPPTDLTHIGHAASRNLATLRGEVRESLFATIPMELPPLRPVN